eukprot:8895776-Ditylum_brightwellii.AAC.1
MHDEHIISKASTSGEFTDKEIQCIDYCWMYLNMTTLANIVLADGKSLDPYIYKGRKFFLNSSSTHMNIHQEMPSNTSWQLWQKAMTLWTKTMHLPLLLGRWCQPGSLLQQD